MSYWPLNVSILRTLPCQEANSTTGYRGYNTEPTQKRRWWSRYQAGLELAGIFEPYWWRLQPAGLLSWAIGCLSHPWRATLTDFTRRDRSRQLSNHLPRHPPSPTALSSHRYTFETRPRTCGRLRSMNPNSLGNTDKQRRPLETSHHRAVDEVEWSWGTAC